MHARHGPESAEGLEPLGILIPSPLGPLGLVLDGRRVTRLVIAPKGRERSDFAPFSTVATDEFLDEVAGRFSEYFAGARRNLDLDYDLSASSELSPFARRTLEETARIPYGRTRTYQEIAAAAGNREGYRLALATLLSNPLPLIIPCHRVVPSGPNVGSWIGGPHKKSRLLRLESQGLSES